MNSSKDDHSDRSSKYFGPNGRIDYLQRECRLSLRDIVMYLANYDGVNRYMYAYFETHW